MVAESATLKADTIKSGNSAFNSWHYVDIALLATGYDDLKLDTCGLDATNALWALTSGAAVLRSSKSDAGSRALMLRLFVHIAGDLHQPLQASTYYSDTFPAPRGDSGGNSIHLTPAVKTGKYTAANLHAFWDDGCGASGLGEATDPDAIAAMAAELDDKEVAVIASTPLATTAAVTAAIKGWADESNAYAANTTYATALLAALGTGTSVDTTAAWWADYAAQASMVARQRVKLGGARLAQVLNAIAAQHALVLE